MRYIIIEYSNGYCGCDEQEYLAFQDNTTDAEIDNYCSERLFEYAENYEYIDRDCSWNENDFDDYYNNCGFDWVEVNPEQEKDFEPEEWFQIN